MLSSVYKRLFKRQYTARSVSSCHACGCACGTFIRLDARLPHHRHALYAWVPPSPRVRCRMACITSMYYLYEYTLPYLLRLRAVLAHFG